LDASELLRDAILGTNVNANRLVIRPSHGNSPYRKFVLAQSYGTLVSGGNKTS
jgi:hypothetical protein